MSDGRPGAAPARAIGRSSGLLGIEAAENPRQPRSYTEGRLLPGLGGVQQARHRRVRDPAATDDDGVAEHPGERSAEPVQRTSRSAVGGGMEASDAGLSESSRSRSRE